MSIPCYLALTAAEFAGASQLPEKIAWMACHFSCYGTGLSNLPEDLPEGSVIILNDRTPPDKHDPQRILEQMQQIVEIYKPDGILLDFQRNGIALNGQVADVLVKELPCCVGVTAEYARDLKCPVFLEPPPLHVPLSQYIAPWGEREIWLELAPETRNYTVTKEGCTIESTENTPLPQPFFTEETLYCRYHTALLEDAAVFTLQRTREDMEALIAKTPQIKRGIGLYQQLYI